MPHTKRQRAPLPGTGEFARTAKKGSTKILFDGGKVRYVKDGKYVILDAKGKIVFFGVASS